MTNGQPVDDHCCDWGHFGWGCSCGKGKEWPLAPTARGRAAANAHLRAVWRKRAAEGNTR